MRPSRRRSDRLRGPIAGNRRKKIASAIEDRINGGCNYWNAYRNGNSFDINNYISPTTRGSCR